MNANMTNWKEGGYDGPPSLSFSRSYTRMGSTLSHHSRKSSWGPRRGWRGIVTTHTNDKTAASPRILTNNECISHSERGNRVVLQSYRYCYNYSRRRYQSAHTTTTSARLAWDRYYPEKARKDLMFSA